MSDILIKGLKIKDYPQTITINPDGSVIKDTFGLHRLVEEWKAIELPSHGDLISKQETVKKLMDSMCEGCHHSDDCGWCAMAEYRRIVENAPTVIEASN